jgi:hypothetical protein
MATRVLTLSDLGYTGSATANNYTHPSNGAWAVTRSVDSGPLTGANVISDVDMNITVDGEGHVTSTDMYINTRALTIDDLIPGYSPYNWNIEASGTSNAYAVADGATVKFTGGDYTTITRVGDDIIIDGENSDTGDTRYTHDFHDSSADAILRLQGSGASTGTSDVKFVAGDYITLTPSGDNLTIDVNQQASWTANDQLTDSQVQTIVKSMFDGNTETRISASGSGSKINLTVDDMTANDNYTYSIHASGTSNPLFNLDGANGGSDDSMTFRGGGDLSVTRINNDIIEWSVTNPTVNNNTLTIAAGAGLSTGGSFTANQSSNSTVTLDVNPGSWITTTSDQVNVDATSTNTANKVVVRDASGNFAANTITAGLTGTASLATKVIVTNRTTENIDYYIAGVAPTIGYSGGNNLQGSTDFYWNTGTNKLHAPYFSGNGASLTSLSGSNISSGTVAAARVATLNQNTTGSSGSCTGTAAVSTAASFTNSDNNTQTRLIWTVATASGSGPLYHSGGLTVNSSSNIMYATDFVASSDMRLKDKVGNLDNALTKVCSLDGFLYTWNDKAESADKETVQVGVSAQQVQEVLPEAVEESDNGNLGVKYDKLVPLLIEAIKELKADNEELRASFEELKSHK